MNSKPPTSDEPEWSTPAPERKSALFGAGATVMEKTVASGVGAVGAVLVVLVAWRQGAAWNTLQYGVAALVCFDVIGGVVANGLNSAKRDHFRHVPSTGRTTAAKLVRRPVAFTSAHMHPIVVGLLYEPRIWWWGLTWYLLILGSVVLVRSVPLYLQRPVALGACACVAVVASFLPAPDFWGWFPTILALKLVLAHAVQEEAYRPTTAGSHK